MTVQHVKIQDTAASVRQILAEKTAGRDTEGSVSLIWINGENFSSMKSNGLLFGPFVQNLPNFAYVDTENKPTTLVDFTVPTDGLEAPWGMAQLVFMYDTASLPTPPRTHTALLAYAQDNPGRFTYPAPPNFHGTTFLKQLVYATLEDAEGTAGKRALLQKAPTPETLETLTENLWAYLDVLHPVSVAQGRTVSERRAVSATPAGRWRGGYRHYF